MQQPSPLIGLWVCRSELYIQRHIVLVRMVAARAYIGRRESLVDVAAHETLPLDGLLALPQSPLLYHVEQALESVVVALLHTRYGCEV